ncbi:MAG TPA: ribbon-helix-helix domain-containing protein [Candidatus Thermoplasmatota archaeon]|nr:ribbon-helix-helix domain-containing protein [Candidatus Thermoplasmatota archaeon]
MTLKQISLSIPDKLLEESKKYSKEFGYKNVQEFILELLRRKVFIEKFERYHQIEQDMKKGKNVKRFNQKDAIDYLESL